VISPFAAFSPADDRGRTTRLCQLKQLPRPPWRVRLAVNHANPWLTRMWLFQAAYLVACIVAFAVFRWRLFRGLAPLPAPPASEFIPTGWLLLPAGCVAMWAAMRSVRPWLARRAIRACVRFGHCSACAYEIRGLPAAPDGCTVCPECGAAWRVDQ